MHQWLLMNQPFGSNISLSLKMSFLAIWRTLYYIMIYFQTPEHNVQRHKYRFTHVNQDNLWSKMALRFVESHIPLDSHAPIIFFRQNSQPNRTFKHNIFMFVFFLRNTVLFIRRLFRQLLLVVPSFRIVHMATVNSCAFFMVDSDFFQNGWGSGYIQEGIKYTSVSGTIWGTGWPALFLKVHVF